MEQNVVEKVRNILVDIKGYPDPSHCENYDKNGIVVYAQDQYKINAELYQKGGGGLMNHSSKKSENIWTDKAKEGKPEFLILNRNSNLAIVIECKDSKKYLASDFLRKENLLVKTDNIIQDFAADGALHYAKFLSSIYDVIAIGVCGIKGGILCSTYFWPRKQEALEGQREIVKKKKKGEEDEITTIDYAYGPFFNLNIETIESFNYYQDFIDNKSENILKILSEEHAKKTASELNVLLDGEGVNANDRAILISGLLLALRNKTFRSTYSDKAIEAKELIENLKNAVIRVIDSEDVGGKDGGKEKKAVLKDKFRDRFNQQSLLKDNAKNLRLIIEKLQGTIYPVMNGNYALDVIGNFYHEFLRYAPGAQNNGIKLTPSYVTDLFCKLVDIKIGDVLVDPCLGTGGFIISGMNHLFKLADSMTETQCEAFFNSLIDAKKIEKEAVDKLKSDNKKNGQPVLTSNNVKDYIKKHNLLGCEADPVMYTLGCSNMILRGDGKSNIIHDDCFAVKNDLKKEKPDIGFMNPPYSASKYSIHEFISLLCDIVRPYGYAVVIVPTGVAHQKEYIEERTELLKKNKLLGVMSMPLELFKGIANTITCIMVFKVGEPHDYNENVYFGNWKEDGYYWHKTKKWQPDLEKKFFKYTPQEYIEHWISSFKNKNVDDEFGIWRKLHKDEEGKCIDEWLWEYFYEVDYKEITESDFEQALKDFMLHQIREMEFNNSIEE